MAVLLESKPPLIGRDGFDSRTELLSNVRRLEYTIDCRVGVHALNAEGRGFESHQRY